MKQNFKVFLSRTGTVILILFAVLIIYRMFVIERANQTAAQVAKIHATKLTMDDVLGKNLPPIPANPDATVQGVDANKNGIRDDVELAIFASYPDSTKTRAVLLQYALALQLETTQPIVNEGTVTAVAQDSSRASMCIGEIFSRDNIQEFVNKTQNLTDFVTKRQINTKERDLAQIAFYKDLRSYSSLEETCDIDLTRLPN